MPGPYFLCSGKLSETLPCYTGLNERGKRDASDLIVDDEPHIARLIEMTLEPLGQPLVLACDGEQAADLLEKQQFDRGAAGRHGCRAWTALH